MVGIVLLVLAGTMLLITWIIDRNRRAQGNLGADKHAALKSEITARSAGTPPESADGL